MIGVHFLRNGDQAYKRKWWRTCGGSSKGKDKDIKNIQEVTMCQPGWIFNPVKGIGRFSLCSKSEGSWVLPVKSERACCGSSPSGGSLLENKNKAPGPTDGTPSLPLTLNPDHRCPTVLNFSDWESDCAALHLLYTPPSSYPTRSAGSPATHTPTVWTHYSQRVALLRPN